MLEMKATACCDRCGGIVDMEDVVDESEARKRLSESGWCEDDDGNDVCEQCWAKYDENVAAVSPSREEQT